jgi:hypothetical protein
VECKHEENVMKALDRTLDYMLKMCLAHPAPGFRKFRREWDEDKINSLQEERSQRGYGVFRQDPLQSFLVYIYTLRYNGNLLNHAILLHDENRVLRQLLTQCGQTIGSLSVELERLDASHIQAFQKEKDSHTSTTYDEDPVVSFLMSLGSSVEHLVNHAEILAAENTKLKKIYKDRIYQRRKAA